MSQDRDSLVEPCDEIYLEETTCGPRIESSEQPHLLSSDTLVPQPGADIEIGLVLVPVEEINVRNIKSRRYARRSDCNKKAKTDLFVDSDDLEFIKMEVINPDKNTGKQIINENSKMDFGGTSNSAIERNTITSKYNYGTNSHFSTPESTEHDIKIELIASSEEWSNKVNTVAPIIKLDSPARAEIKHSKKLTTNRPSYTCNDCNKTFYSPTALMKHSRLHAVTITQKLYLCEECGNIFLGLTALNIHARTHTVNKHSTRFDRGEKNTLNDLLLLRSPSNDSAKNADDKLFACLECNESYGDVSSLIKHNRMHAIDKPFCCETCGKLFRLRHSLTSHMLCHTGNKSYVCNECNKAFSKSDTWARHKETCGIIFGCKECGLTFTARHHLNLHSRVHSGIRRIIIN